MARIEKDWVPRVAAEDMGGLSPYREKPTEDRPEVLYVETEITGAEYLSSEDGRTYSRGTVWHWLETGHVIDEIVLVEAAMPQDWGLRRLKKQRGDMVTSSGENVSFQTNEFIERNITFFDAKKEKDRNRAGRYVVTTRTGKRVDFVEGDQIIQTPLVLAISRAINEERGQLDFGLDEGPKGEFTSLTL